MVNQRDQRMRLTQGFGLIRHHTEREPVDHDRTSLRHIGQVRPRGCPDQRGWIWKTLAQIEQFGTPTEFAQFRDHALVISITAGRSIEIARHRENEVAFHQSGASYHARALGDSPTVTRIAAISFGERPSLLAFTAAANWSNTHRVSHSVVVLTPLNSAMSSRFL